MAKIIPLQAPIEGEETLDNTKNVAIFAFLMVLVVAFCCGIFAVTSYTADFAQTFIQVME